MSLARWRAALLDIVADRIAEARAVVPGRVDAVARAADRERDVDFAPGIGRKMAGEDVADGTVPSAPVVYPAGGGFSMTWPLESGDECLGLVSDRNPERWRANRSVGETHAWPKPHDVSNSLVLPVSITAPGGAPEDPEGAWVVSGGAGEAIHLDLNDGELTLTKSGTPVASLTLTAAGAVVITPAPGKSVEAGGALALALGQATIDAVDAMLANGVPVANDGGAALLSTMTIAWSAVKTSILAQTTRGA